MLAKDGVVGLDNFATLIGKRSARLSVNRQAIEEERTMNLRSLVNVKRMTASIRSRGSSESLILCKTTMFVNDTTGNMIDNEHRGLTKQRGLADLSTANTPSWE